MTDTSTYPTHPTPFLLMDLNTVSAAYDSFTRLMPGVAVHYAMKCNPEPRILQRLQAAGCRFEIASYPELEALMDIGVDPQTALFSNPVKMAAHIRAAASAGLTRFSFDSRSELDKIATEAPGASVYVRLQMVPANSLVASEGKFGVANGHAFELMQYAQSLGLEPYGIAFHVGSQMHDPSAWTTAIAQSIDLMKALDAAGIHIKMLDMGGGFPAQYEDKVPPLAAFADAINAGVKALPYAVELVIEPGRALVGDAGVMVATVIGTAERSGKQWLHLDVGAFNGMMEALETQNQLRFPLADDRHASLTTLYHVTGPSCDSQDTIMFDAHLSEGMQAGDRVFIRTAGAYTTSYASRFNGFDVPAVYVLEPATTA